MAPVDFANLANMETVQQFAETVKQYADSNKEAVEQYVNMETAQQLAETVQQYANSETVDKYVLEPVKQYANSETVDQYVLEPAKQFVANEDVQNYARYVAAVVAGIIVFIFVVWFVIPVVARAFISVVAQAFISVVHAIGFGIDGIVKGTLAAMIMASYGGSVTAGSICAILQNIGATSGATIVKAVLLVGSWACL
ncbi:hypothetical protein BC938DRAFT_475500 [Jimgerdemannia flammicorona]|uniref:Uncharacterized protein n=1 Tax=Jimgerdemannia flammicorona TaxID=994334 RepID=A0A433QRI8_9FUNG|nr:hypothetical protein BC938DRAFT_475500 [Jimgerdemannia flammicorona]